MRVQLTINEDGTVDLYSTDQNTFSKKRVMLSDVAELFQAALEASADKEEEWLISPTLPPNTLCYKESKSGSVQIAFSWGPDILQFEYENTLFSAIPFPRLIFCMHGEKIGQEIRFQRIALVAIKETGVITDDTPVYRYPFSHVGYNTHMCFGANELPRVKKLTDLKDFPRNILTTPNGTHHYSELTNMTGKPLREVLQLLNNKKKFPVEWLRPLDCTFRKWIESI